MTNRVNEIGTEEKIKEAAKAVFLEKGFDGATMKDIANAAGMNSALTHYYFRSKEKLFWLVFESLLKQWIEGIRITLDNPTSSLKEKIIELIESQFFFHAENPDIILFLMNETQRDPEGLWQKMCISPALQESYFFKQVEEAAQQQLIRPVNPMFLLSTVFSSIKQSFAGKALYMRVFNLDEAGFIAYTEENKNVFTDMILTYLFKPDC